MQVPCLLKISGKKIYYKYFVKTFQINRYRKIIPFLPVIKPTIRCFEFCKTQCLCEFQSFLFYYDTIYRYFSASFSDKPAVYCLVYLFVEFSQRVFFLEEFTPFFSNEAVNLCLFLTHVETVFRGTPYLSVFVLRAPSISRKHLTKN